jgi:signal peptidase II
MNIWGPLSGLGLAIAAVTAAADQVDKAWMIGHFASSQQKSIAVAPFFDIVLIWNRGVSYGLFPQNSDLGRWTLVAVSFAAAIALTIWLASIRARLAATCVGLIIGGAIGNAVDRIQYGAVADFFSFHVASFHWYVFNVADVAIVCGVLGLLYDSFKSSHKRVENQI